MSLTGVSASTEEVRFLAEAGHLCLLRQEYAKAKQIFEGLEVLRPDADLAIVGQGQACFLLGDAAEATKHYKRALKANPKSGLARFHLAELLQAQGKNEEALAEIKAAREAGWTAGLADLEQVIKDGLNYKPKAMAEKKKKK